MGGELVHRIHYHTQPKSGQVNNVLLMCYLSQIHGLWLQAHDLFITESLNLAGQVEYASSSNSSSLLNVEHGPFAYNSSPTLECLLKSGSLRELFMKWMLPVELRLQLIM